MEVGDEHAVSNGEPAGGTAAGQNGVAVDTREVMDLTGDSPVKPSLGTPAFPVIPGITAVPATVAPGGVSGVPEDLSAESSDDDDSEMDDSGIRLNLQGDEDEEHKEEEEEEGDGDGNSLYEDTDEDREAAITTAPSKGYDGANDDVITIDSSSDEEEVEKGRSKAAAPTAPNAARGGAIAVSTGLKLGGGPKAVKVIRAPAIPPSKPVEVVDYSAGTSNGSRQDSHALKGLTPNRPALQTGLSNAVEVIDLLSDPAEPQSHTETLSLDDLRKPSSSAQTASSFVPTQNGAPASVVSLSDDSESDEDEDEEDSEGEVVSSDGDESDIDSVDTETWARQQRYYVRQPSPPLLHEEARPMFATDYSGAAAAKETRDKVEEQLQRSPPKKRKICDICLEPHITTKCNKVKKCVICHTPSPSHFSFSCPHDTLGGSTTSQTSSLPIFNVPTGQKDYEVWKIIPEHLYPSTRKAKKIPIFCYECGDNDHFGDDCPGLGRMRNNFKETSIWNARSAKKYTSMGMESRYLSSSSSDKKRGKKGKKGAAAANYFGVLNGHNDMQEDEEEEDDDDEDGDGWFGKQMREAKQKVPDADIGKDFFESKFQQQAQERRAQRNGGGGGRGVGGLPARPPMQMQINIPTGPSNMGGGGGGGRDYGNPQSASSVQSFSRFQGRQDHGSGGGGGRFADRVGPRGGGDSYRGSGVQQTHNNQGHRRERSRSPIRYDDNRGPSGNYRPNYDQQYRPSGPSGDRGGDHYEPRDYDGGRRDSRGYNAVPPPPPPQSHHQGSGGGGNGGGWRLPGSVQDSISYSSTQQPPLPAGPPPGQAPREQQMARRGGSHRGGGGGGGGRGGRNRGGDRDRDRDRGPAGGAAGNKAWKQYKMNTPR